MLWQVSILLFKFHQINFFELTGDAGFVARPHTVAGVAKAFANSNALISALVENAADSTTGKDCCSVDISAALRVYDASEVATMHNAVALGQSLGEGTVLNVPTGMENWTEDDYKTWMSSLTNVSGKMNIYRS